ncbi:transcriptional regulator [Streptomyces sp. NPDC092296]|uniref:transcriptional regulator n=1 Tax=Streptomyces sp. NPDC092296 TaxID=3366012 RepID=UPI00380C0C0A
MTRQIPRDLPTSLLNAPDMLNACRARDFAAIFTLVRKHAGIYPSRIAALCDMTPSRVGEIVKGQRTVAHIEVIERVADGLRIPGGMLGLAARPWETGAYAAVDGPVPPTPPSPLADAITEMDDMNRRELLRLLSVTGTMLAIPDGAALGGERGGFDAPGAPGRFALADYTRLNEHLWKVFALAPSKSQVLPLVRDQLDVLRAEIGGSPGAEARRDLCVLISDLFQLAGEAFFDSSSYTEAAHCYTLAAEAGKEAAAFDLWACALTRHAFISIYERQFTKATPMLELASALARRGDSALSTRYWVAAAQAEAYAGLGDFQRCQRSLDTAGRVDQLTGRVHTGGWLRFDGSRLAEQRGSCYATLQRPDLAEEALNQALVEAVTTRRRAGVLVDLAKVGAQLQDTQRVITYTGAAMAIARRTNSGVVGQKLRALDPLLTPFKGDVQVRQLHDEITALGR